VFVTLENPNYDDVFYVDIQQDKRQEPRLRNDTDESGVNFIKTMQAGQVKKCNFLKFISVNQRIEFLKRNCNEQHFYICEKQRGASS